VGTDVAGLGNALVDALVRVPDDALLARFGLTRGQMHPVEHGRWQEIYEAARDPAGGAGPVEVHTGGSCANTIAALAMMGGECVYAGQVGRDDFGALYARRMEEACGGHALQYAGEGNTGKCLSIISEVDAERTMITDLGVAVSMGELGDFAEVVRGARVLHLTGYLFLGGPVAEVAWAALEVAREAGVTVSLDVADPFVVGAVREHIWRAVRDYTHIVFLNADEASALTDLPPEQAVHEVSRHVDCAVVKLGSKGSLIKRGDEVTRVGIHRVEALDTTGAGDAYAAGFLHGWLAGWAPWRAGSLGAMVAARTVAQVGAVCRDVDALRAMVDEAAAAVEGV